MNPSKEYSREQTLPSGLIVEVAPWTVDDVINMSDAKGKKRDTQLSKLVGRCRVVDDPRNVYTGKLEPEGPIHADVLLSGDRLVLLLLQRLLSHGKDFDFDFHCADPDCKSKTPWRIDLRRLLLPEVPPLGCYDGDEWENEFGLELLVNEEAVLWASRFGSDPIELGDETVFWRPLSDEALGLFQNGNRFPYEDSDGNALEFKLFTGRDEKQIQNTSTNKRKRALAAVMQRIISIDGVDTSGKSGANKKERWLRKWPLFEFDSLQAHIDDFECGIESELEVECGECGLIQPLDLPMDDPAFFSPKQTKKKSGRIS